MVQSGFLLGIRHHRGLLLVIRYSNTHVPTLHAFRSLIACYWLTHLGYEVYFICSFAIKHFHMLSKLTELHLWAVFNCTHGYYSADEFIYKNTLVRRQNYFHHKCSRHSFQYIFSMYSCSIDGLLTSIKAEKSYRVGKMHVAGATLHCN